MFFNGEKARRNRSPWVCPGKVPPPKREDQREVAKRPQRAAPGNISRDWKRAVSHFLEGVRGEAYHVEGETERGKRSPEEAGWEL